MCAYEQKLESKLAAKAESESKADYAVCCACALQRLPSNLTALLALRRYSGIRAQKYYDNTITSKFCAFCAPQMAVSFLLNISFTRHLNLANLVGYLHFANLTFAHC